MNATADPHAQLLTRIVELHHAAAGAADVTIDQLVDQAVELERQAVELPVTSPGGGLALLRLALHMAEGSAASGAHHERTIVAALRQAEAVFAAVVEHRT